jgi:hypothetical protein
MQAWEGTVVQRHRTLVLDDGREAILGRSHLIDSQGTEAPDMWVGLSAWVIDTDDNRLTWRIEAIWEDEDASEDGYIRQGDMLSSRISSTDAHLALAGNGDCTAAQ